MHVLETVYPCCWRVLASRTRLQLAAVRARTCPGSVDWQILTKRLFRCAASTTLGIPPAAAAAVCAVPNTMRMSRIGSRIRQCISFYQRIAVAARSLPLCMTVMTLRAHKLVCFCIDPQSSIIALAAVCTFVQWSYCTTAHSLASSEQKMLTHAFTHGGTPPVPPASSGAQRWWHGPPHPGACGGDLRCADK